MLFLLHIWHFDMKSHNIYDDYTISIFIHQQKKTEKKKKWHTTIFVISFFFVLFSSHSDMNFEAGYDCGAGCCLCYHGMHDDMLPTGMIMNYGD